MIAIKFIARPIVLVTVIMLLSARMPATGQSMPSFEMQLTNGKIFTNRNLQKNKPVLLIYYAPDCEHCQALITQIFRNFTPFRKLQIVLVTFEPLSYAQAFERNYQVGKHPNIISGMEAPTFYFKNYYKLVNTPFTALFDRHGKMVVSYRKMTPVDDLIKHIQQLK
jgi:thioredoxin-related protein